MTIYKNRINDLHQRFIVVFDAGDFFFEFILEGNELTTDATRGNLPLATVCLEIPILRASRILAEIVGIVHGLRANVGFTTVTTVSKAVMGAFVGLIRSTNLRITPHIGIETVKIEGTFATDDLTEGGQIAEVDEFTNLLTGRVVFEEGLAYTSSVAIRVNVNEIYGAVFVLDANE